MNLGRRRIFVPEVVQTSVMDCGPASLKCLAEGFGIPVSYGRLREACQTDVDGTSIDTMEEVAVQLGLEAEQIMAPADFVLLPEANLLPAIAVVVRASKLTHFVVAWRSHGALLQVMDPAVGRQWEPKGQFVSSLYIHTLPVSAQGWREWAESEKFTLPVRRKLDDLGISAKAATSLIESALDAPGWRALARLEAGTRSLGAIVRSGGLRRGKEAERVLERLLLSSRDEQEKDERTKDARTSGDAKEGHGVIPRNYWSAWPAPPEDEEGEERVFFKGAVLVHVTGRRSESAIADTGKLPPEVAAALEEKSSQPARDLLRMLKADGLLAPAAAVTALGLATLGVLIEAILFRSLLDMPREFRLSGERLGVMAALLIFLTALMLLELPIASGILRIGRHLEARLRTTFLEKIPKLGDRYFHSRLTSDMAERSHSTHRIRLLPGLGGQLLRSTFELIATVAGIIWLDVRLAVPALVAGALAVALPLMVQPMLTERDLRVRNHTGALSRFYLDALLGLVPVLTHRAERALRREHESLLVEWAHASFGLQRLAVWVEALQGLTGFGLAAWLMLDHISRAGEAGGALLLVYWALNLPGLGEEIAQVARQYPSYRNVTLRLLEPIDALEDKGAAKELADEVSPVSLANQFESTDAAAIELAKVNVHAAGHTILEEINLKIAPGDHVAIVGASGAGKSSLLGLLLGWYRPAVGSVLVDGAALEGAHLDDLRQHTVWIDPAVQLWNRSLFSNLCYGNPDAVPTADLLEQAELRQLLEKLPDGMQTELGESGGLVSGGEGQRVRFGRALLKSGVRLALLDEPFRGLDRHQRRELLARARRHWAKTTLLCVTHDVGETLTFSRTLVIENGRIVEDGNPAELARQVNSRYRALLEAEETVREGSWSSGRWRRLRLEDGRLIEELQRVSA